MNTLGDYQIRRSTRAKRARIIVTAEKIEVVAPLRMPEKQIRQFVAAKQAWLESAKNKVQKHVESIVRLSPLEYTEGALIPYQGEYYVLALKVSQERKILISFEQGFVVSVPESFSKLTSEDLNVRIQQAFIHWMMQMAAQQSRHYIERYAALYHLHPRSIVIKTQKSRWGSCGIHNDINLNWLLILAPAAVLEYVVIHELCHIQERNHSAAFWLLVAKHCPDYKSSRQWLKQHGASLMLGL
ncbi:MAG: M48 family metallopeptidase [Methylococcaceae bacterium]|nr:M48 family metallopeptidase [Methylococcaceae bacterium]